MKALYITLFFAFFCIQTVQSQLTAKHGKNAWQRTAYEDWDDFRPWWYFHIVNNKYRKTDRRTMYARMGQMTLWSVYADNYEQYARSVDSVLQQETYKALDKSLNKNYLVLQKSRITELYDKIEIEVDNAIDGGIPEELYSILSDEYVNITLDIDFLRSSYSPDAEKYPLIEQQIEKLEGLLSLSNLITALAAIWEEYDLNDLNIDYTPPIEEFNTKLDLLIEE